ncbi:hypothetical protein E2C01_101703 [Portunus trituberculatus]|uniref:Uncharacterized protein n=1 Tax=Portunus trituberculatus TaxID=210409 RepID=A0A5B7KAG0_PORTR|nr:hypothetical protein [Portunus trituberculatus]
MVSSSYVRDPRTRILFDGLSPSPPSPAATAGSGKGDPVAPDRRVSLSIIMPECYFYYLSPGKLQTFPRSGVWGWQSAGNKCVVCPVTVDVSAKLPSYSWDELTERNYAWLPEFPSVTVPHNSAR